MYHSMKGGARRSGDALLSFERKRRNSLGKYGRQRGGGGVASWAVSWVFRNTFKVWVCILLVMAGFVVFIQLRAHPVHDPAMKRQSSFFTHYEEHRQDTQDIPPTRDHADDHADEVLTVIHVGRPPLLPPEEALSPNNNNNNNNNDNDNNSNNNNDEPRVILPPRPPSPPEGPTTGSNGSGGAGGVLVGGGAERSENRPPAGGGGGGADGDGGLRALPNPAGGVEVTLGGGGTGGDGAAGPLETFLAQKKKLPVVLLTCNRREMLRQTIESLRKVRGLDMSTVMVLQDGTDDAVAALVREHGLYLKQNTDTPGLRGGPRPDRPHVDGAKRIAMHYKFSLDHAFEMRPDAPAVVIVEDDLLLSPDFLEYFEVNAPVLERDPTTLVLSAWNDNGYVGRVSDERELMRTLFFPGLGWLLTRELFDELRPKWPREHWDHWLREPAQHRGRECVFPEVPRTYHNGAQGTFMDQSTHERLFKNIMYQLHESFSWKAGSTPAYENAISENYERKVEARIRQARHLNRLKDLPGPSAQEGQQLVMWYTLEHTEENARGRSTSTGPPFKPLSEYFGIWHEYKRGEHSGMHTLRWWNMNLMLINAAKSPYVKWKPAELLPAPMNALHTGPTVVRGGALKTGLTGGLTKTTAGESASLSCDEVCSAKGMTCKESTFYLLNSCVLLMDHFPCTKCSESYGLEQPCYVEQDAPAENLPGQCLTSSHPSESKCSASHRLTRRLCPCTAAAR